MRFCGPIESFQLGEQVATFGLQIAMVESHDAASDDANFLEDVTANRGGALQFFENEKAAKEWLGVE